MTKEGHVFGLGNMLARQCKSEKYSEQRYLEYFKVLHYFVESISKQIIFLLDGWV